MGALPTEPGFDVMFVFLLFRFTVFDQFENFHDVTSNPIAAPRSLFADAFFKFIIFLFLDTETLDEGLDDFREPGERTRGH